MDLLDCIKEYLPEDVVKQTKELYDEAYKSRSFKSKKSEALPELIVEGFDTEQIWQQIELLNNDMLGKDGLEMISKTLANNKKMKLPVELGGEESSESSEDENEKEQLENEAAEDEPECEDSSDDDSVDENLKRKSKQQASGSGASKKRKMECEDQFFSLKEMNDFLTREDMKEMSGNKGSDMDDSDSDEDEYDDKNMPIDLFNDPDEEGGDDVKRGSDIRYADFFDSPENGNDRADFGYSENDKFDEQSDNEKGEDDSGSDQQDEQFNDEHEGDSADEEPKRPGPEKTKKVKFNLLANSDDSDLEEAGKSKGPEESKSSFEARNERLKKRIEQLEAEAVSEKPWQLRGEATARSRPKDSLLEEYVEFDTSLRPAPVMTEKTTMKLEDIIRSRIRDKVWDDVEKKVKPVETPLEYKKKLVMNQEKSKESLAQIYENEYIKQREALTEGDKDEQEKEEPPEHIEIRERIHALFRKLDALSNFHYTPKPAKPEIKIVSNIPAINMEEVAPVATSDATLLAPEEVKGKPKGDLLGKSERTKTDKKRERRKKKLKQHNRAVYQSKKEAEDEQNPKNKKKSKTDTPKITGRNIINNPDSTDKQVKSSTAFFTQLQNEVTTGIQEKLGKIKSKKKKDAVSAVKLKL